ncbi:MAG TPA: FixH family protein [Ktedonobacteraceae bacterium]|nr:FixH family protein [Ktedonobacteraceae bacterium]
MKRKLLILVIGLAILLILTWAGAILPDILPQHPTAHVQTANAGPYHITLQTDPNPPHSTQTATLSLRITHGTAQQLVTNAHVTLTTNMETMDMGTDHATARQTVPGTYQVPLQFSMGGPWDVHITVEAPGTAPASTTFKVTAQ